MMRIHFIVAFRKFKKNLFQRLVLIFLLSIGFVFLMLSLYQISQRSINFSFIIMSVVVFVAGIMLQLQTSRSFCKEIGIRKLLGATDSNFFSLSIINYLTNAVLALLLGFIIYENRPLMHFISGDYADSLNFLAVIFTVAVAIAISAVGSIALGVKISKRSIVTILGKR